MTLSLLEINEIRRYLDGSLTVTEPAPSSTLSEVKRPTGTELAERLAGLLSSQEADEFERHINESCEQIDA